MVDKKLVEKIVRVIKRETDCDPTYLAKQILKAILSDPNIVEIDPDAELPPYPKDDPEEDALDEGYTLGWIAGTVRMLDAGWVLPKKRGKDGY